MQNGNFPECPTDADRRDHENENPGTLAGVTGASFQSCGARHDFTWVRIRDAIPNRHVRAFAALHQAMVNLRRGADHTESLARVLAAQLGPRELIMVADAAGRAYQLHHEVEL